MWEVFILFHHFLAEKYAAGLRYRSLNCYWSVLSLLPVDGFQVSQHPLMARLLKGVFNCRPLEPLFRNLGGVVSFIYPTLSLNEEDLPLKLHSQKLIALLVLVSAHCCSDLNRFTLQRRKYSLYWDVLDWLEKSLPYDQQSYLPSQRTLWFALCYAWSLTRKQQLCTGGKITCSTFWPLIPPMVQSQPQLLQDG